MTLDDAWRDQKAYRYDGSHQLIAIEHADGARSEYEYDALGRRVAKHHTPADGAQQTTLFMWDGDWMMQEVRTGRTSHEDRAVTYVPHPDHDGPLTRLADGQAWHYVTDHLGTPQELYDEQREVVWAADLSAYGRTARWLTRVVDNPIRFPGQYRDEESGLHYNRFRYYDPMMGRYVNKDPIDLKGGLNLFSYVDANPLLGIDPLGLVNPAKLLACGGNVANSGRLYISGGLKLAAAAGLGGTGIVAPAGMGVAALGVWNINSAGSAWKRAVQQCTEAGNEKLSDASWKNLLGVLPYGSEFDDPSEPSPYEFFKEKGRSLMKKAQEHF
ncbi:RHS repeat domain-containing protein [Burkholderia multivorans]|uniref:RHS repeat domain-containing protein n=1 Tax=Burkholderia multivorans TaxID=87883 RepID=UPI0026997E71